MFALACSSFFARTVTKSRTCPIHTQKMKVCIKKNLAGYLLPRKGFFKNISVPVQFKPIIFHKHIGPEQIIAVFFCVCIPNIKVFDPTAHHGDFRPSTTHNPREGGPIEVRNTEFCRCCHELKLQGLKVQRNRKNGIFYPVPTVFLLQITPKT